MNTLHTIKMITLAGMNTLHMIKMIPTFDGPNYVEWTRSFNDILQITWPFLRYLDLRGQSHTPERTEDGRKVLVISMTTIQIVVK